MILLLVVPALAWALMLALCRMAGPQSPEERVWSDEEQMRALRAWDAERRQS